MHAVRLVQRRFVCVCVSFSGRISIWGFLSRVELCLRTVVILFVVCDCDCPLYGDCRVVCAINVWCATTVALSEAYVGRMVTSWLVIGDVVYCVSLLGDCVIVTGRFGC